MILHAEVWRAAGNKVDKNCIIFLEMGSMTDGM
jgi:hypothetical protein